MADAGWDDFLAGTGAAVVKAVGDAAMGDSAQPDTSASAAALVSTPDDDTAPTSAESAATWADYGRADLATAAAMEEVAAEHLEAASEWARYGDVDAAREELAEAHVAAELGAEAAMMAQTELEIAAAYNDSSDSPDTSQSEPADSADTHQ
jgi:hypothetical protein